MRGYVFNSACIVIILGAALYSWTAPSASTPELDQAVGQRVAIEGTVVEDPDLREKAVLLTTRTDVGTVLVEADQFTKVSYGDRIHAEGTITLPQPFDTDTRRTFNYPMYLRAHGITHVMGFARVTVLGHGNGNWLVAKLTTLKHYFESGVQKALPEPESSLLAGLLVGDKRGLGTELTTLFRRAGVVHIIVLSGYNVALVINTVRELASKVLARNVALGFSGVIAILFMLMVGASETAIRATLMALVVLVAKALHRPSDGLRILLFVAAGMALWNPYLVLYDISYQLSILATLGLILFSHRFVPYLGWLRSKSLIEIVSTTLATQITVLPVLIISVGQVSVVSLITNILILLPVPYAMFFGFFASLVALISPELAFPLSAPAYALLTYIIHVSAYLGSLPFAAIQI